MSENEPPKEPLSYRSREDDFKEKHNCAGLIIGGAIAGIILTIITGCMGISVLEPPNATHPLQIMPGAAHALGICFWVVALLAAYFSVRQRGRARWGLMGLCIGLCVGFLIEGLCFIAG